MARSQRRSSRLRVGRVSLYLHHGALWLYYRDGGKPVRRKVNGSLADGEQLAAQVNAQPAAVNPEPPAAAPAPAPAVVHAQPANGVQHGPPPDVVLDVAPGVVHAQPVNGVPHQPPFTPISVPDLRERFLDYHEHVLRSSLGTVRRYNTATRHLVAFVGQQRTPPQAHEIDP